MASNPKELTKFLRRIVDSLNEHVLVVEGKKDLAALRAIGIDAPVFLAHSKPERIARRAALFCKNAGIPVAVLTDFDEEGNRKAEEFRDLFLAENLSVNEKLRNDFRRLFGVRVVEGVGAAFERINEEIEEKSRFKKGERNGKDLH